MTVDNFNWFIHVMLFIHKERVIQKQLNKTGKYQHDENENDSDEEDNLEIED